MPKREMKSVVGLVAATVGAAMSAEVSAFTLDASIQLPTDTQTFAITSITGGVSSTGVAGRFNATINSPASSPADDFIGGPVGDFWSWCIEPQDFLASPDEYDVKPLSTSAFGFVETRRDEVAELFSRNLAVATGGAGTSQLQRTAFQIALWELFQEDDSNPLNVTEGTFDVTGVSGGNLVAATNAAAVMLGLLDGTGIDDTLRFWVLEDGNDGPGNTPGQSQIAISVVPLPAAVWGFGSMLLVLAGVNSRKRRRGA